MSEVYITRSAEFLPNKAVANDEMEEYLGYINGKSSRSRKIVLRSNKIEYRYYALDKEGNATHSNAEMTANAIRKLFVDNDLEYKDVDILACGTSTPDQLMPAHGYMVHGELAEAKANVHVLDSGGFYLRVADVFDFIFLCCSASLTLSTHASAEERFRGR